MVYMVAARFAAYTARIPTTVKYCMCFSILMSITMHKCCSSLLLQYKHTHLVKVEFEASIHPWHRKPVTTSRITVIIICVRAFWLSLFCVPELCQVLLQTWHLQQYQCETDRRISKIPKNIVNMTNPIDPLYISLISSACMVQNSILGLCIYYVYCCCNIIMCERKCMQAWWLCISCLLLFTSAHASMHHGTSRSIIWQ